MKHGPKHHPGEHGHDGKKAHERPTHHDGHKHLAEGVKHLMDHHHEVIIEVDRSHERPHKKEH